MIKANITNICFKFLKILFINFFFFIIAILIIEIFFGYWFKNILKNKLSSERNVYRVYKTDFKYLQNSSIYIKNNYGFRVKNKKEKIFKPDIVFVGGSTVNQKFLNYEETTVGILREKFNNLNIINAGVDGMSIKGHINSFEMWFDKIENFKPRYYIFMIGINDRYMIENFKFRDHIDVLEESDYKSNLREKIEANSFFITKGRIVKSIVYLKYGLDLGVKKVKKNHVYLERNEVKFTHFEEAKKNFNNLNNDKKKQFEKFISWYLGKLEILTKEAYKRNAIPIFINQTTGYGHSIESFVVAESISNHCKNNKLKCINLAQNLDLKYGDFYDESHVNKRGSKKIANYIYNELLNFF